MERVRPFSLCRSTCHKRNRLKSSRFRFRQHFLGELRVGSHFMPRLLYVPRWWCPSWPRRQVAASRRSSTRPGTRRTKPWCRSAKKQEKIVKLWVENESCGRGVRMWIKWFKSSTLSGDCFTKFGKHGFIEVVCNNTTLGI